jgi:hypothetical protein
MSALFQASAHQPPTISLSAFPHFVYSKFTCSSAPCPSPPSLVHSVHLALCCVSFSVPCLLFSFCFCGVGGQSVHRAMLVYPRGSCGNTIWRLFAHLLVCISKQVWSQCLVAWEPSCFLSVMWCAEALYVLGVQGVVPLFFFFSTKCGSRVSGKIFIYGAHAVCFHPLVTILDLLLIILTIMILRSLSRLFLFTILSIC